MAGLSRSSGLNPIGRRKLAQLRDAGLPVPFSTLPPATPLQAGERKPDRTRKPIPRGEYTGPDDKTKAIIWRRCNGRCEFAGCRERADDVHHRYERGSGGTGSKSAAAPWINQPANLLGACRHHNDWVSNQQPREAERIGWLLRDANVPPCREPVQTCHDPLPVWLDNAGGWHRFDEGAA